MFRYGLLLVVLAACSESVTVNIRTKTKFKNVMVLKGFWKNTGLCPSSDRTARAEFLLSPDENVNLDYVGAVPNSGIEKVRIHWLLDLVKVREVKGNDVAYDFTALDRLLDRLHRNGLTPGFELMGNPSDYFYDFTKQATAWTDLIKQVVAHYTRLYGVSYVRDWRFELTNEPDLRLYNPFNFTLDNYTDYFRASESAVRGLTGPAGLFRNNKKVHSLCWGLLDYCNLNPCNLDMITFHRKGNGAGSRVVQEGLELIDSLLESYPNLKGIPFGNDEADIMTGWSKPFEWRADVRYAALVAQVIIGHINEMMVKRELPFELLSNDNAFLSFSPDYFTQRTLLARFQMNNTSPPHVQFFRKPVYSVMGLLSLLGQYLIDVHYQPGEKGISYLTTTHPFQEVFLAVVVDDTPSNDTYRPDHVDVAVKISVANANRPGKYVGYIMDNDGNSPHGVWKSAGSPDFPDVDLRRRMRQAEGFQIFFRDIHPNQTYVKFVLRKVLVPSIICVNMCFEGLDEPGPVTDLRHVKVTNNEILLFWSDTSVGSRCLTTYLVEFKSVTDDTFRRVNANDSIFLSYHFDGRRSNGSVVGITGEFRVAAVDFWKRLGPYSNTITVTD